MRLALVGPELEENLALRYIHAAVLAAGHEAGIFDFHEPAQIAQLVKDILAYAPDAVGLSMVFTARGREYADLARSLRWAGYAGHITAGGHFASFHADLLLRDVPAIDSILHGEGEAAAVDLLDHLAQPLLVAGISCRDGAGRVISTPSRPPADDLDNLPFPTRSAQFQDYFDLPIANILSGRGCFADCAFCSINAWHRRIGGRRFRQRSVENLADEMAHLYHDCGVRLFNFHDDNFFLPTEAQNIERFGAIRDALAGRDVVRIGIQVKARPDTVEPESMRILKEIGLFRVFLGVESNAVAGLKALNRGITCQRNGRALALLKGMGLHVTFNLLMFEPDCTIADLRDNIAFIREQSDVPLNFCRTEVYAGTALEKRLRAAGRLEGDYWGYGYTIRDPRAQLAYEMFRVVFSPRNFELDGMNLCAMAADYYFHVLRYFHPQLAGANLKRKVVDLIGELNANNAELLARICDFAQSADPTDAAAVEQFTQDVGARRIAFDVRMEPRFSGMLSHMRQLAAGRSVRPGAAVRAAATAATALLATVLGCGKETQPTEMAPPDRTTRRAPPSDSARRASAGAARPVVIPVQQSGPTKREPPMTFSTEMVARPPATRPASRPATTRGLSAQTRSSISGPVSKSDPMYRALSEHRALIQKRYEGSKIAIASFDEWVWVESPAAARLFPSLRFASLLWTVRKHPDAKDPMLNLVPLITTTVGVDASSNRIQITLPPYGNYEDFGRLLATNRISIGSDADAKLVWEAFCDLHQKRWQSQPAVKQSDTNWHLGDVTIGGVHYYYDVILDEHHTVQSAQLRGGAEARPRNLK